MGPWVFSPSLASSAVRYGACAQTFSYTDENPGICYPETNTVGDTVESAYNQALSVLNEKCKYSDFVDSNRLQSGNLCRLAPIVIWPVLDHLGEVNTEGYYLIIANILRYYADTNRSAESYLAVGKQLIKSFNDRNEQALEIEKYRSVQSFISQVEIIANREMARIRAEYEREIRNIRNINDILNSYLEEIHISISEYMNLRTFFENYGDNQTSIYSFLSSSIDRINSSDLDQLRDFKFETTNILENENQSCVDFKFKAGRLKLILASTHDRFLRKIAPYHNFMAEKGFPIVDEVSETKDALSKILYYSQNRQSDVSKKLKNLIDFIKKKREVLVLQAADQETKEERLQATHDLTSPRFLDPITELQKVLFFIPESTEPYGLPLLMNHYMRLQKILQFWKLCESVKENPDSWQMRGCSFLERTVIASRSNLNTVVPKMIYFGLKFFAETKGESTKYLRAEIQKDLERGDLYSAILGYDLLVLIGSQG